MGRPLLVAPATPTSCRRPDVGPYQPTRWSAPIVNPPDLVDEALKEARRRMVRSAAQANLLDGLFAAGNNTPADGPAAVNQNNPPTDAPAAETDQCSACPTEVTVVISTVSTRPAVRLDGGPPKWGKSACTNCKTPCWNAGEDAAGRCKACIKNPERVKRCAICFENELVHKWDSHGCSTDVCKSCATTHIQTAVADGATFVKCPGCPHYTIGDNEAKKLDPSLPLKLRTNRAAAASTRLVDLFEREPEMLAWATSGKVQICPHCSTFVERTGGCAHIACKCGGHFCYQCGASRDANCSCDAHAYLPWGTSLLVDFKALIEQRRQRRLTFLMGSRCEESVVYKLPPDLLRRIVDAA